VTLTTTEVKLPLDGRRMTSATRLLEVRQIETMDMITRYFLRRLAISGRKPNRASPSARYRDALVDVILIVLGLPAAGILLFVGLGSMSWWDPIVRTRWPWLGFRVPGLILWVFALIVGHLWLGRRFSRYRDNPTACMDFASESDRRIVFWQKLGMTATCGIVAPCLGIAVNHFVK
jgi:hypothetical protein